MKYGVVIFPSKKLQDLVNSYRKRYDSHYALIPPHLTLKSAFAATDDRIKDIAEKIETIAKQYNPFTLKVTKVSSFQPVNNVIYLKIEPTEELEGIHSSLHDNFFDETIDYAFTPHITLGQNLSDDEHSDILNQLKMLNITHEEEIDRFHLLYQLENGSWTVYETFRLGKEQ